MDKIFIGKVHRSVLNECGVDTTHTEVFLDWADAFTSAVADIGAIEFIDKEKIRCNNTTGGLPSWLDTLKTEGRIRIRWDNKILRVEKIECKGLPCVAAENLVEHDICSSELQTRIVVRKGDDFMVMTDHIQDACEFIMIDSKDRDDIDYLGIFNIYELLTSPTHRYHDYTAMATVVPKWMLSSIKHYSCKHGIY